MAVNPIKVWNGTAWEYTGPVVAAPPVKYQATQPSSPATGDVWVESDVDVATFDPSQIVRGGAYTDEAARSSAITSPVTGMITYVGDTGTDSSTIPQIETYTGSAWQTPYGLTQLANVSVSAASSVSLDNVFSSTYDNYIVQLNFTTGSVGAESILMRMRVSGTDNTSSNYYWSLGYVSFTGTAAASAANSSGLTTSFTVSYINSSGGGASTINLYNPFNTAVTRFHSIGGGNTNGDAILSRGGNTSVTTSYTGATIFPVTGTMTGTIKVYGLRNS